MPATPSSILCFEDAWTFAWLRGQPEGRALLPGATRGAGGALSPWDAAPPLPRASDSVPFPQCVADSLPPTCDPRCKPENMFVSYKIQTRSYSATHIFKRVRMQLHTSVTWSFCAMLSTATFREHVTKTLVPGGRRAVIMWKMVVDFPVPGGP